MLDITVGHLRRLCRGQRFPSQELTKECRRLEEALVAKREREIGQD